MTELLVLIIIFSIPLFAINIRNTLTDLYFWQIKEYRWDRFWNTLRWDLQKVHRNSYVIGLKFILFALVSNLFIVPPIGLVAILLAFTFWTYQSFTFLYEVISGKLIRPKIKSVRNLLVIFMSSALIIGLIVLISIPFFAIERPDGFENISLDTFGVAGDTFRLSDVYILLGILTMVGLIIDMASPIIMPIYIVLTQPLAILKRYSMVSKARNKFKNLSPKLTVVGITGSQGKTTTKEILYIILKDKYKVVKTPENYNTALGISDTVMRKLNLNTEIFIAEMGAYRPGEIANMVYSFPTDISIITDIDTQHLALFGSSQKLLEAKYEIVKYMKPDGLAILNGDNFTLRQRDKDSSKRTIFTSVEKDQKKQIEKLVGPKTSMATLEDVKHTSKSTTIKVNDGETSVSIKINRIPEHNVMNYLMAIMAAKNLNMTLKEIKEALESTELKLPRLQFETGDNDTIVLNDSYSSSRKGFIAAVNEMTTHKKKGSKSIVITRGILELGKHKKSIYDKMMNDVAKHIDVLITSDHMLAEAAKHDNEHMDIHLIHSDRKIIYKYRELAKKGDVILLEGRLHPSIVSTIVSDKH